MKKATKRQVMRWSGFLLGAMVVAWKGTIGKAVLTPLGDLESGNKYEDKVQFQKQDAVGVFRLGYVDCQPYTGPEQVISIDEAGQVECIQPSLAVPGVTDGSNSSHHRAGKLLGVLRTGTILKGELAPALGFVSVAAKAAARIASMKMQVVYLPGGPPAVWLAVSGVKEGGGQVAWDEIYVRSRLEASGGVAT